MVSLCGSQALRPADVFEVTAGGDTSAAPESGVTSAPLFECIGSEVLLMVEQKCS
jgi:hypothetical protein